ncbi:TPA: hypothetical protein U2D59_000778 [Streptococcus suis]|uniref:hypothetical protein n=1 Tax=Streptococcus suis TaxID=1307 RepID=UPI00040EF918|nr:hypothetical protein [Streptococcus suis]MCK3867803.1 hypothetical protein [Streptococcus suis]NQK41528.1 hypothetical protein [Streptococcus suis]HEL1551678.1 hypothetical protein [Streptococcus suis]HEL2316374.1 hypothetical protein [Streptococcus suis]HEL2322039.1 hypothetical protein [Streptococcus suis]
MSTLKLGAVTLLAGLALFGGATAQAETFTAVSSEATGFKTSDPCRFDGEEVSFDNSGENLRFINGIEPGDRGSEGILTEKLAKQLENGGFITHYSPAGQFPTVELRSMNKKEEKQNKALDKVRHLYFFKFSD